MEDGEGTEEVLMARDVGRGASADGKARDEDVCEVDVNVRKRPYLAYGIHDVAMVLRHSLGALRDQPCARDAHGVRRDGDEPLPLGERAQMDNHGGSVSRRSVEDDDEREYPGFVVRRKVVGASTTGARGGLELAEDASPAAVRHACTPRRDNGVAISYSRPDGEHHEEQGQGEQ